MIKLAIYASIFLFVFSCSEEDNLFGGYNDPRYFENIGLNKNPLGENVFLNIEDLAVRQLFSKNQLSKIFILGYYRCPQMCNSFRSTLFPQLMGSDIALGQDYEILMLSINPEETISDARKDRDEYFSLFFEDESKKEYFNFMISNKKAIKNITEDLGFQYRYDQETKEYYHPTIAYVLLSDGTVSNIIDFGEKGKTIENKINLANSGNVLDSKESSLRYLTCMARDTENKNPKMAFGLAQFGSAWFVCCSVFCFGYNFLSRREKNKEK